MTKFSTIPRVELGLATGSINWGLAFPEDVHMAGVSVVERDMSFDTPYGPSENWKLLEFDASITSDGNTRRALCMYSHGNPRDVIDHACHRRAFWVLMEAGVKRVLSSSTVGAMNKAIRPGDLAIAADIIELTQTPYSLLPGRQRFDCSGKRIVCSQCAGILAAKANAVWPRGGRIHGIESGLVAGHTYGPRLTTPAEAMAFRFMGADIINHSLAPEATLSREIGACFVPLAVVTAGFNDYMGLESGQLLQADVIPNLTQLASRLALEVAAAFPTGPCSCHDLKSPQPPERHLRF